VGGRRYCDDVNIHEVHEELMNVTFDAQQAWRHNAGDSHDPTAHLLTKARGRCGRAQTALRLTVAYFHSRPPTRQASHGRAEGVLLADVRQQLRDEVVSF
jgi:hypothetical protein